MNKINILVFILILFTSYVLGQEQEHKTTGKIDINTLIGPVDTLGKYVVFNKKRTLYKIENKTVKEKEFFVDIPIGLNFQLYAKQGKTVKYFFSGINNETIVVEVHYDIPDGVSTFKYFPTNEKLYPNLESQEDNTLKEKYAGVYLKGRYVIYYYNVGKDKLEIFNYSIQSIRNKK